MNFQSLKNLRTDDHLALKKANSDWNVCVTNKFLPEFFKGAKIDINEVCGAEFAAIQEADAVVNPDFQLPFNKFKMHQ